MPVNLLSYPEFFHFVCMSLPFLSCPYFVTLQPWEMNAHLREPMVIQSKNGVLSDPLSVELFTRKIDNLKIEGCNTITTRSYNGEVPGPTIRVKPGDMIAPLLTNNLPTEVQDKPSTWPMNIFHQLNYTNLHTHGLHVAPGSNVNGTQSDNVLVTIKPTESVQYEIQVPMNHPSGTYWYHPHRHGSVAAGVTSGLAGMLIIEDMPGEMPDWISNAKERTIVIQEINIQPPPDCNDLTVDYNNPPVSALTLDDLFSTVHPQGSFYLVNGQYRPVITMRPGQVERWRFGNFSADTFIPISIDPVESTSVSRPDLRIIARDGITLDYPEIPARNQGNDEVGAAVHDTAYDRRFRIGSGNRLDVMIKAPSAEAVFKIQSMGDDANDGNPDIERPVLAYLVVKGEPMDMAFPSAPSATSPAEPLPAPRGPGKLFPQTLVGMATAREPQIGYYVCPDNTGKATCTEAWERYGATAGTEDIAPPDPLFLVSGPNPGESGGLTEGAGAKDEALLFSSERIDHCMAINTVEEWTVCNPSASTHPFHIHTNAFEVIRINGVDLGQPDPTDPGRLTIKWLDTVPVPSKRRREPTDLGPWECVDWDKNDPDDVEAGPPSTIPGSVVLRSEIVDFTGFMVQHCHILKHEDTGMMQLIEIYDPEGPGTSIPGTDTMSRCTNELP